METSEFERKVMDIASRIAALPQREREAVIDVLNGLLDALILLVNNATDESNKGRSTPRKT